MTATVSQSAGTSTAKQLVRNLATALEVAGNARRDGQVRPLRAVDIQRSQGIARSTLAALLNPLGEGDINPDLRTLTRLADALGIPVAFLLMRREDWQTLGLAINDLPDPVSAAEMFIGDKLNHEHDLPALVLKKCGLHPEKIPEGIGADPAEQSRIQARNEQRRRTSHVLGTLMLPSSLDRKSNVLLTALAGSLANQLSRDIAYESNDD